MGLHEQIARTRAARRLGFIKPLMPALVDEVPAGNDWIHEIKYDGYRTQLLIQNGHARAFTRRGFDWTARYQPIARCADQFACRSAIIDGEIIVQDANGRSDFHLLRERIGNSTEGFALMAFDLLHLDGRDLRDAPLEDRRAALGDLLGENDPARSVHFSEHIVGNGPAFFAAVDQLGLEGIVSKKLGSRYRSGPSRAWLKIKCFCEEELVVIGTSTGDLAPRALLAREEEGKLVHAGPAMVTLPGAERELFWRTAEQLRVPEPPIPMERRKETGWVRPAMRVRVQALRGEELLRHAMVKAVLSMEEPAAIRRKSRKPRPSSEPTYPEPDISHEAIAAYYHRAGELLLRWAAARPLNLFRCPKGRCLFQRHLHHPPAEEGTFGSAIHQLAIHQKNGKVEAYFHIQDLAGVRACVAANTVEFHGWGSLTDDVERPDRLVIDLDPDEGLGFEPVKQAAIEIRDRLMDAGLESFALLTGGKGIHVVVPLTPEAEWPAVRAFARLVCAALADEQPDRFTVALQKAQRHGRIFLDYLRNQRASTAVLPYSVRARPGLPVAAPIAWNELDHIEGPDRFCAKDHALLLRRARGKQLRGWGLSDQIVPMGWPK